MISGNGIDISSEDVMPFMADGSPLADFMISFDRKEEHDLSAVT